MKEEVMNLEGITERLDPWELRALLEQYDAYIQRANDEDKFREGWRPVCIAEFYYDEFLT